MPSKQQKLHRKWQNAKKKFQIGGQAETFSDVR